MFFISIIFLTYFFSQALQLADGKILSSRLIIDAMGNFSPVVKQVEFPMTVFVHPRLLVIRLNMKLCILKYEMHTLLSHYLCRNRISMSFKRKQLDDGNKALP